MNDHTKDKILQAESAMAPFFILQQDVVVAHVKTKSMLSAMILFTCHSCFANEVISEFKMQDFLRC